MKRETSIETRSYRGYRIEIRDDGGAGWAVVIHAPPDDTGDPAILRNEQTNSLADLLTEAHQRVDRRLDGGLPCT